ncbi:MAG: NDP-sugar synthase, partial [Dehalococcoidales bacterium]
QKARLTGPVVIGPGCRILDNAVITESVIWQAVNIGSGASIGHSVIASNCRLGDGSIVEEAALGDNVTVANGYKLEVGSKIGPGTAVG